MQGRSRISLVCVCLLLVTTSVQSTGIARAASRMLLLASQTQSGPDALVSTPSGAALRTGPGTGYRVIARLAVKTPLSLTGRNATSTWFQARTATSSTGWVLASQIKVLLPNVKSLAIMSAGLPAGPRPAPLPAPLPAHSPAGPLENVNIGKLRAIFQKGQKLGNRARAFSKIGDSSVRDQQFLYGFGLNKQTLGAYSYLQATIDFFSIPARPGFANSFVNESLAAVPAFNAAAAFDASWTSWTDPNKVCSAEEGPLDCELRVV
ncbi:MAG: SH3 domain-containing protein, partial [Chloroflexi bacterium]|nr:SH3 domain-containing protein [Chloroflexota bacterium]